MKEALYKSNHTAGVHFGELSEQAKLLDVETAVVSS